MKNALFLILCSFTVSLAQDADLERFCDSLMPNATRSDMPASLLIVAKDGKPLVRKAYGMANLEMGVPASTEHCFTLASVNKQMLAICILQLANNGKLKMEDDIRKYLPDFESHGRVITVEQLLNHTSGIFSANSPARGKSFYDHTSDFGLLSDKQFIEYAGQAQLLFEPGTDWSWNTFGFYLTLFVIEKASGMPFNDYVRKHLFEPAGMENSISKVDGNRLGLNGIKKLNTSFYFPDADGKWVWRDTRMFTPYFFYQRYAIVTSLDDLVKWDEALRNGKLLPLNLVEKAWTAGHLKDGRTTNYGLGWVVSEYNGYKILSHIGIGSNPIVTMHVPQERLYIVCTQFFGNIEQVELRVKKILSRLLPLPYPKATKAYAPLSEYSGVYQVHRNGLDIVPQISDIPVYMNVTVRNDTLFVRQTASPEITLRPAGRDKFLPANSENVFYEFFRDDKGNVNAVATRGTFWPYGPEVRNLRVEKTLPPPASALYPTVKAVKKYIGVYYHPPFDSYIFIETDGTKLYNRIQGRLQELIPVADNKFVRKGIGDVWLEFKSTPNGAMSLTVSGLRSLDYKKLD